MRGKKVTIYTIYWSLAMGLVLSGCAGVVPYTVEQIDLSGP
jgi:hypothetical protein